MTTTKILKNVADTVENTGNTKTGAETGAGLTGNSEQTWNTVCSTTTSSVVSGVSSVVSTVVKVVIPNKYGEAASSIVKIAGVVVSTLAGGYTQTKGCPDSYEDFGKDFINPTSSTDPTMADDFQNDYQGAIEKFNENKKKLSNLDNADVVEAGEEAATNQEAVKDGAEGTDVAGEKNNTTPDDPAKKNAAA